MLAVRIGGKGIQFNTIAPASAAEHDQWRQDSTIQQLLTRPTSDVLERGQR